MRPLARPWRKVGKARVFFVPIAAMVAEEILA